MTPSINIILKVKFFCDLFAGTSCVGDSFKGQYRIIANDFMNYSYCFSKAKLNFGSVPNFKGFLAKYGIDVFEWLNTRIKDNYEYSFIYDNYTPAGGRMFLQNKMQRKSMQFVLLFRYCLIMKM